MLQRLDELGDVVQGGSRNRDGEEAAVERLEAIAVRGAGRVIDQQRRRADRRRRGGGRDVDAADQEDQVRVRVGVGGDFCGGDGRPQLGQRKPRGIPPHGEISEELAVSQY